MGKPRTNWTLDEALPFVRSLGEELYPDWYVALAGSVLMRGNSEKDLDVLVFPRSTAENKLSECKAVLTMFGLKLLYSREVVTMKWIREGSNDTKHVEVWEWQNKRVDLFFVS